LNGEGDSSGVPSSGGGRSFLYELLIEAARAEGFPLAGAVDIAAAREAFGRHLERYDQWLREGFAGTMEYLRRGRDRRADPALLLPGARSVFCVAWPYRKLPAGRIDPTQGPRYARYLEGGDYHEALAERLGRVMVRVSEDCAQAGVVAPQYKICVDTSAVLERSWAALCGLGWIGKNTLLIHPQLGSYFFLAEVILDAEVGMGPKPLPDYCGNCSRCLDACPTNAFPAPRRLDSRRCISYLTLEKRGEFEAPPEVEARMGSWVAGCDVCQEVCPFNRKAVRDALREAEAAGAEPSAVSLGAIALDGWSELLSETPEEYQGRVRGSALSRVKPAQFRRNLIRAWKAVGGAASQVAPEAGSPSQSQKETP
jgi:epoxyqueuosine reductase